MALEHDESNPINSNYPIENEDWEHCPSGGAAVWCMLFVIAAIVIVFVSIMM